MFRRQLMLPGTIAVAAWLATGCGRLPTEPSAEAGAPVQVNSVHVASDAKVTPFPIPGIETGTSATARVQGNKGGTVHWGQFTVVIPAGAFSGQATITVSQPNPTDPRVDLSIWPASKNHFKVPVTLVTSLPRASTSQITGSKVRELDPVSGGWTPVDGQSVDVRSKSVQAPLVHFSSYRVDVPASQSPGHLPFGGR